ncbi:hypothetical protein [Acidithiobacillus ferrooxidans]|uniref:hypothetical protein n=1 Tax=Acidithiobacillus ferrooxidans TaxID=920 RepID=UPI000B1AF062|nr:hypothetical protein [Acidithiobacillus ferrooxidans]
MEIGAEKLKDLARKLKAAGYIPGQSYEQCRNMALWHPGMADVMRSINSQALFSLVTQLLAEPNQIHHRVVLGKTGNGMSGFLTPSNKGVGSFGNVSPEEAERILGNTSFRISLHGEDRQRTDSEAEHAPAGNHAFRNQGTKLIEAGYVPGMEYRHALEMGKWHPEMERFLTDLSGRVGDPDHQEAFNHAKSLAALELACTTHKIDGDDSDHAPASGTTAFGKRPIPLPFVSGFFHKEGALDHSVTVSRTADGMSDAYQAFVQDLHELLVKHADVINRPGARADGMQLVVSNGIMGRLRAYPGVTKYIQNLRFFDVCQHI